MSFRTLIEVNQDFDALTEADAILAALSPRPVGGGIGSISAKGGNTHRVAATGVVALLDEVSALCTSFNDQIHDADDTLGKINHLAYAGIAALRPAIVRTGK